MLIVASPCFAGAGHGDIEVSLDSNGKIVTSGGDGMGAYAGRIFEEIMPTTSPIETDAPGFDGGIGTFAANANVRFNFVHQLLFWNGTALTQPSSPMTISFGSRSATISGSDTGGAAGFDLSAGSDGSLHRHVFYSLNNSAADGLYGIALTLGPGAGATGFSTSDPFLIAFSKGNVLNVEDGINAMTNVALVPEPSGVMLAGLGAAGMAWVALRRRGRRRMAG